MAELADNGMCLAAAFFVPVSKLWTLKKPLAYKNVMAIFHVHIMRNNLFSVEDLDANCSTVSCLIITELNSKVF